MKKILFLCLLLSWGTASLRAQSDSISSPTTYRPRGYRAFLEGGGGWGREEGNVGVTTTHGRQINPHWFVGVGTGAEIPWLFLPLYADARYSFFDRRFTPFADLKVGGSPTGDNDFPLYLAASVGISYQFTPHFGINLSVGYLHADTNTFNIRFGFEF